MYKIAFAIWAILCSNFVFAQNNLSVRVVHPLSKDPVVSASVFISSINKTLATDSAGSALFENMPAGQYKVSVSHVGFQEQEVSVTLPLMEPFLLVTLQRADEDEEEEVIVQSTRTSRTIANVPTRVETIELEEIDEKSNMRPANVAMILHESTGIQVQQTSATSGNSSIRIQGLDGRYTQLLKDGFPNFGNFSSGLSILEIPPLDLKQVEIIKGPASPLFGAGAIAGVVNFVSRTPKETPEYNFIVNHSNIGQTNIGGFAAQRGKKAGYTLLALYNRQKAYDVDEDDFTEVPESDEFTINPKLFLYPAATTTITIGNSFTKGQRTGGDLQVIKNQADAFHQYFEKNEKLRNVSTLEIDIKRGTKQRFIVKQSFSVFDRKITIPSYQFAGVDHNAFTDVSYVSNADKHALVLGGNFAYNSFREKKTSSGDRNNTIRTGGLYGQHTWDASETVKLESGLRVDVTDYRNDVYSNTEVFVLPRLSLLVKYDSKWSSRFGGGMGYKTPTIFTEETETIQYRNVEQLNDVRSEKSYGGTADVNFKTSIVDDLSFSLNQMFFYTTIEKPIVLQADLSGKFRFVNAGNPVHSAGFETNAKFIYKENFKLFLGYTYTAIKAKYLVGNQFLPLVPRRKLNTALIYEKGDVIKIGLEGYFTGRQHLSDGTQTPAFKELGFMAEKIFNKFSLYINFENFTDTRQSRYKNVVNGSHIAPRFDEIWTHTEGFVFNGGIKLKL
jgi:iron complex outermembrane receptor protein/outer membrane receptor for ferrienterochelin and colicins